LLFTQLESPAHADCPQGGGGNRGVRVGKSESGASGKRPRGAPINEPALQKSRFTIAGADATSVHYEQSGHAAGFPVDVSDSLCELMLPASRRHFDSQIATIFRFFSERYHWHALDEV
jgi:hypothetical protein